MEGSCFCRVLVAATCSPSQTPPISSTLQQAIARALPRPPPLLLPLLLLPPLPLPSILSTTAFHQCAPVCATELSCCGSIRGRLLPAMPLLLVLAELEPSA